MEIFLEERDKGVFGLTGSLCRGSNAAAVALGPWQILLFAGTVIVLLVLQASPGDFEKPRLEGLDIHQC